ncbi:hypothetical protein ACR2XN_28955 [Klebsiella pneumoniae]
MSVGTQDAGEGILIEETVAAPLLLEYHPVIEDSTSNVPVAQEITSTIPREPTFGYFDRSFTFLIRIIIHPRPPLSFPD